MSHIILFDAEVRIHLLPLTYARPVGDLRVGILTIAEKWERHLRMPVSYLTQDYLQELFPLAYGEQNLLVNGSILPTPEIVALILDLSPGEAYIKDGELIAACLDEAAVAALAEDQDFDELDAFDLGDQPLLRISRPADVFGMNDLALREDFALLTAGRTSEEPSATNTIIGPRENLFLEEGVKMEACILNVEDGPVYIGKNAVVLEGSLLRSPLALGESSVVKMGAKVYGGTTIGPKCKVGGEVNNVVFQANSNKGHDGFLGNAAIGEWCNIGADTNASNLKNDYGEVRVWSYPEGRFAKTGLQFHGLVLGDHSKAGINTMFNTGTVVGFSSNVYGEGFPRTFLPSFIWGGAGGVMTYKIEKAKATAERVMARRKVEFTDAHSRMFDAIFDESSQYRKS
ncbi:glucose-1-phosphate thymidylyltransferase [Neolewinella aurantiaca]|uniref:Glucose-1-phosphate thymidylyltransferase n=1 Tax=Neolewinella aurantiaca TaxID=2602767 RepID=A0A5C7FII2_9BACT|nr:GlmU family protein [Neolewinella aurantiaca]TXF90369.1 glucose-1-phosphate thymidylyltransferase [Neolewinella aurantiaca]